MANQKIEIIVESQTQKAQRGMDNLTKSMERLTKSTDNVASSFGKMSLLSFGNIISGVAFLTKKIGLFTQGAIDASEKLNLFNVVFENVSKNGETTFSELGEKAMKFQNIMHEAFGTNKMETMSMQANFMSLGKNLGIGEEYAEIMSESMTKLSYDLSSLYNKKETDVAKALQSSVYAGQTKPIRAYGADVTQNTLSTYLKDIGAEDIDLSDKKMTNFMDAIGINDRSISDLNQAEKEILRYYATLKQTAVAQKDFANTIESPANQLKILRQQFQELSQAIGSLFIKAFAKILPYVNAIIMVVKEVMKAIGSLFGLEIEDYNASESIGGLNDSMEDFGDSVDGANKKAKELKRTLLGFDQVNNITTPTSSGSSGSGGISGSVGMAKIDERLLKAIKDYDNGMEGVRMKATRIRDAIMEWLGFTKQVDEKTKEVYFTYEGLQPYINKIKESTKKLGEAFGELEKYSFENLTNFRDDFLKPIAKWTLGKGIPSLLDITRKLIEDIKWRELNKALSDFYKAIEPFAENVGDGLLWFYKNVLEPLGAWTMNVVVINFLNLLSEVISYLNEAIEDAKPYLKFVWEEFLQPIAKWTGGKVSDILKGITDRFKELTNWYSENKDGIKMITDFLSFLAKVVLDSAKEAIKAIRDRLKDLSDWVDEHPKLKKTLEDLFKVFEFATDPIKRFTTPFKILVEALQMFSDIFVKKDFSKLDEMWNRFKKDHPVVSKGLESIGKITYNIATYLKKAYDNDKFPTLKKHVEEVKKAFDTFYTSVKKVYDLITANNFSSIIGKITSSGGGTNSGGGKKGANGLSFNGTSFGDVRRLASGGLPNVGQMFIAREAGPELVGKIGSSTAVVNNQQIVSSVANGVAQAVKSVMGSSSNAIEVTVHTDEGTIIDRINRKTRTTGVCPIEF